MQSLRSRNFTVQVLSGHPTRIRTKVTHRNRGPQHTSRPIDTCTTYQIRSLAPKLRTVRSRRHFCIQACILQHFRDIISTIYILPHRRQIKTSMNFQNSFGDFRNSTEFREVAQLEMTAVGERSGREAATGGLHLLLPAQDCRPGGQCARGGAAAKPGPIRR